MLCARPTGGSPAVPARSARWPTGTLGEQASSNGAEHARTRNGPGSRRSLGPLRRGARRQRRLGRAGGEAARRRPGRRRPGARPRRGARSRRRLTADLDDRDPDYIRENLPLSLAAGEPLVPGRGPQPGQHPRAGAGAAGRQPHRRQPLPRDDRLHARLLDLLRGRAALLPARPQPRARLAARAVPAPLRDGRRLARARRARRSRPRPPCSSSRAATGRSTGRAGRARRSTSPGARASSGWRWTHDVPIVPVVTIGGQETALFLDRGAWLAKLAAARQDAAPQGPADLDRAARGDLNVGDFLPPHPAAGEDHDRGAAADRPARAVRPRARRRRGLRARHAA